MSSELTKVSVDKVVEITGMKAQTVRDLLESGWTFTWTLDGKFVWDKNVHSHLLHNASSIGPLAKIPTNSSNN